MAPCEASRHASIVLFVSRFFTSWARMIRGPVASARGGPSGADREAAKRAPEAKPSLPATLRLDRHRGPGREPMASSLSIRPRPEGFGRPSGPSHSGPRTDFPNNTVRGWLGLEGQWRRIRTFDRQIRDLMLYPTELSVVQTAGFEPATSGPKSGALPLSYIRDPNPRNGAVHRTAKPPARAEAKAPTVVLASVFVTGSAPIPPATGCRKRHCRGIFAASLDGGISATLAVCPARSVRGVRR